MRAGVVVNPRAGRGRALTRAEHAAQELASQGIKTDIACSDGPGSATELAREMASAGCQIIFAAGGDGSINEVVQGIAGTEAILGVIPAGLANVWAADVGLSAKPGDFAELARSGLVFETDLGTANGRYFLAMAGIGFDAAVVAAVTPESKSRWAHWAYVREAIACACHWQPVEATISSDDRSFDLTLLGVIAANASRYAGLFDLAPDSRLDDGLLEVLIYRNGGAVSRMRSMVLTDYRTRRLDPCATTICASELSITTSQPLPLHADAELAGATPCGIQVAHRRLPVLLPAAAQRRYIRPGRPLISSGASLSRYR